MNLMELKNNLANAKAAVAEAEALEGVVRAKETLSIAQDALREYLINQVGFTSAQAAVVIATLSV